LPGKKTTVTKLQLLRQQGALHPHPEAVTDALFQHHEFFDPHDGVQVKYEMLRRVQIDQAPVNQAAHAFGFSRPSFYQAQVAFAQQGLAGLLPQKRGPRRAHKLNTEVMEFIVDRRTAEPRLSLEELVRQVQERFDMTVHPRSIERRLARQEKKRRLS
jgi:transposase